MTDDAHMCHALGLAARGLGRTWPNPSVGCVIAKDGRIVGRGWTQPGGRPHAETMALAQAGALARGGTAFVTLEPCSHHGHTPPCTDALIAAGIARVVTALTDPDPRVCGRGHAILRTAGISVTERILTAEAARLNAGFLKRMTKGVPLITLKLATTLDGRTATSSGQSRWITGPQARRATHALRLTHDAVMVGAGTARTDDPDLTARDLGATHQPVRIVIDPRLTHRPDSRLGLGVRKAPVWLLHTASASAQARADWTSAGATLIETQETADGQTDLHDALTRLGTCGLTRILCEGGATLAAALIRANLVDDVITYTAGALIGADGHPAVGPLMLDRLAAAPRLTLLSTRQIGQGTQSHWTLADTIST